MRCSLSPLQRGMLLKSVDQASRDHYIIQTIFAWTESISPPEFRRAWEHVAANHEILRSTFGWKNTVEPFQEIQETVSCEFHTIAAEESDAEPQAARLQRFLQEDLKQGFALDTAPPWRVTVLCFADGIKTAVWTFHHVLLDGRSHVSLLRELLTAYDALLENRAPDAVNETPQRLHVEWLKAQDFFPAREFWTSYLNLEKLSTELPKPADYRESLDGHVTLRLGLGRELTDQIDQFSKAEGVSAGNVIQTAWALVLGWLANENDVTFGAVRACRKSGLPDGENLVGVVINTLPLRVRWTPQSLLRSVVASVASDWRRFRTVEHTPLQDIGKWVGLPTNRELFATAVSFSSEYFEHAVLGDSSKRLQRKLWLQQTTPFCAVDASFDGAQFHLTMAFPRNSVLPSIADRLPVYLRNTIDAIVSRPETEVSGLSPLEPEERNHLVTGLNGHWEPPPSTVDWLVRISSHSMAEAEPIAIKAPDGELSWQALESQSKQLAAFLARQGVQKGDLIATFLPRSAEYVRVCLGILKSGAAYLPLDPNWPIQRVIDILSDAGVKAVITSPVLAPALLNYEGPVWLSTDAGSDGDAEAFSMPPIAPDDLAYVIYTSGSTGTPKGVEVTHRGLQNLIEDTIAAFALTSTDRGSSVSNPAFDASVHEIWPLLAAGAGLYIPDSALLADPRKLLDWLEESRISFSFLSTAMAEAVLQLCNGRQLALRYLLTGGDQLRVIPQHRLPFQLVNEYGPTESTVIGTRYRVSPASDANRNIPIGQPITGTRAYVVNQARQLLPPGVPGELLLAGSGLARGYRNRPEVTTAKFIDSCVAEEPGVRLYRTGDLVRWSDDGNLQFLGRIDGQVKLRGFRIELGEIEACTLRHPRVAEAVVVLESGNAPRLIAFIVPKQVAPSADLPAELKSFLRGLLPSYMIPASIMLRDRLPVNSSGKYDRQALLKDIPVAHAVQQETNADWSETERQLVEIWKETLNVSEVQADDRFLELGATSLSIIKLLCAVELRFGRTLTAADILNDPTPGELAGLLEGARREPPSCVVALKSGGSKPPIFMIPGAGGGVHWFRRLADSLEPDRPMLGLELLGLSRDTQEHFTVSSAARELNTAVTGIAGAEPFILCGYSGGGLIALELASQLTEQGKTVAGVILLETHRSEIMPGGLAKTARWIQGWLSLPAHKRREVLLSRVRFYSNEFSTETDSTNSAAGQQLQALKSRHIDAFASHKVRPYGGDVAVISAEDRPLSTYSDPAREWRDAVGNLKVLRVEGDHYSMLGPQHASKLAKVIGRLADDFVGQNFPGKASAMLQTT